MNRTSRRILIGTLPLCATILSLECAHGFQTTQQPAKRNDVYFQESSMKKRILPITNQQLNSRCSIRSSLSSTVRPTSSVGSDYLFEDIESSAIVSHENPRVVVRSYRECLYDILEVPPTATPSELKNAYRELAKKTHPDSVEECSEQERREFSEVAAAWRVLSDPVQRAQYDRSLRFSRDVNVLISSLLDQKLGNARQPYAPSKKAVPTETFTENLENLVSELVEELGTEAKEQQYLPQSEYTIPAITMTMIKSKEPTSVVTYYDLLEVPQEATRSEIKSAFIKMARKHHPDAQFTRGYTAMEDKDFAEIIEAYKVLYDPKERLKYDRTILAESFTNNVENFVVDILENGFKNWIEEKAKPFIRQLTATVLSAASRVSYNLSNYSK